MKRHFAGCVLLWAWCLGCGSSEPLVDKIDDTRMKLQTLSSAYFSASSKLKRAPQEPADLLPFLGAADASEETKKAYFRSAHDGEEFVIVWGTDLAELAKQGKSVDFVLIYERKGKGGTRYVLKPPIEVAQVSEEVFLKEKFPGGHKPSHD